MKIILKSLTLKNFKGIKDLQIDFSKVTNIYGENATGKTTIVDSFMWLLFGKDSKDRKDFDIKTLDPSGEPLHGLEHSVTGVLEIDGSDLKLQRIYKEKWSKPTGKAEQELKSHTTDYYLNDIPVKQKEYNEKINELLNEDIFKLVTSPLYFSNLNWKKQREILLDIIGDVDDETVLNYNSKLKKLDGVLKDGIDNYLKRVKSTLQKLKKNQETYPVRIDECNNQIVSDDFTDIEIEKRNVLNQIEQIDSQIADKSKINDYKLEISNELFSLKSDYNSKLNNAKLSSFNEKRKLEKELSEMNYKLQDVKHDISLSERSSKQFILDIENCSKSIDNKETEVEKLRKKFIDIREEQLEIDENKFICPMCKRPLDADDIEYKKAEMLQNFNEDKAKRLEETRAKGKTYNSIIADLKANIEKYQSKLDDNEVYIKTLRDQERDLVSLIERKQTEIDNFVLPEPKFDGMEEMQKTIEKVQEKLNSSTTVDNSELLEKKKELTVTLSSLNNKLAKQDNNVRLKARISELEKEEKEVANKIAQLEGEVFLGEEFIKTKVEILESSINKKFKGAVQFKLFKQLVNGGLEETCEATVNGVPFSNANTASQINAGLSIIDTLCEHYNITAPIFIDNREAINNIVLIDSQIINLRVSKDKNLRIEEEL